MVGPDATSPSPVADNPAADNPAADNPAADNPVADNPAAEPAPGRPRRRPWTRGTKIGVAVVALLCLVEGGSLAGRYLLTDHRWVIADNAQVDGDPVRIDAPATGIVTGWRLSMGSPVRAHDEVGRVQIQGSGAQPRKPIRSPGSGTVTEVMVTEGTWVDQGALLAIAYAPGDIFVTARVPEDEIADVHPGAAVDILVDASPADPVGGTVTAVGAASAGADELDSGPGADPLSHRQPIYPSPDTDPQNPQRVDQYIPVRIAVTLTGPARVTPGQNVTAHIHR